jgi:hypothetical protein
MPYTCSIRFFAHSLVAITLVTQIAACGSDSPPDGSPHDASTPPSTDSAPDAATDAVVFTDGMDERSEEASFEDAPRDGAPAEADSFSPLVKLEVRRTGQGTGKVTDNAGLLDCGVSCVASVSPGSTLHLTAIPEPGSRFAGWGDPACGTMATCDVTVEKDRVLSADFERIANVTVTIQGSGTVRSYGGFADPIECPNDCTGVAFVPSRPVLSASAARGFRFDGWSGGCAGTKADCELNFDVTSPRLIDIGARFVPVHLFSASSGSGNHDINLGVATGSNGDFAAVGRNSLEAYVGVWSAAGTERFSRLVGAEPRGRVQIAEAVTFDREGNVLVAGRMSDKVDFGSGAIVSAGEYDAFIAAYKPDGTPLWSTRFGDVGWQIIYAIAVDADGSILVGGQFEGTLSFGGTPLVSSGAMDAFVAKLRPNRSEVWSVRLGTMADSEFVRQVAPGPDGSAYYVGGVGPDTVVGRVDGSGVAWSHALPTSFKSSSADDRQEGLAVMPSGDVVVSNLTNGRDPPYESYVARYSPSGMLVRERRLPGVFATAVASDPSGNVVLTGTVWQNTDLGTGPLPVTGSVDLVVAKLDGNFDLKWAVTYGDFDMNQPQAIATDASGNIVIAGMFGGTLDFGTNRLESMPGSFDAFVAKFAP